MTTLFVLVGVCIWGLGFMNWRLLERSTTPLSFVLWIVAKLSCSCLCLFDAIVELHAMNDKMFNDFLIGSESEFYKQ